MLIRNLDLHDFCSTADILLVMCRLQLRFAAMSQLELQLKHVLHIKGPEGVGLQGIVLIDVC